MMKRYNLKYGYRLVAVMAIFLIGCSKEVRHIDDKISKDGSVVVENLYEIISQNYGFDNKNLQNILKYRLHYEGNYTQSELMKEYRLSFYFTHDSRSYDPYETNSIAAVVLIPCDSSLNYDDYIKYPIHFRFDDSYPQEPYLPKKYGAFFKVEDLESYGYISKDRDKQKSLCLFEKWRSGGMGNDDYFSSNKLIYTAEEINAVMDAYEALK